MALRWVARNWISSRQPPAALTFTDVSERLPIAGHEAPADAKEDYKNQAVNQPGQPFHDRAGIGLRRGHNSIKNRLNFVAMSAAGRVPHQPRSNEPG